jgi:hypothetical protein
MNTTYQRNHFTRFNEVNVSNMIEASCQLEAIQLCLGTLIEQGQMNTEVMAGLHSMMVKAIGQLDDNMPHT